LKEVEQFFHSKDSQPKDSRIAVHCVAGLGRAPTLVALAMINNGCDKNNAIELIRKERIGAINMTQSNFILDYKVSNRAGGGNASCCTIF
jgi:protein tyrosine phosphatase type 4A